MTEQAKHVEPVRSGGDEFKGNSNSCGNIDSAETLAERFPDFDTVDAVFKFERDHHGCLRYFDDYECGGTSGIVHELSEQRRLWTVIDGDDSNVWICAGFAFVNRLTYLATVRPLPQSFLDLRLTVKA